MGEVEIKTWVQRKYSLGDLVIDGSRIAKLRSWRKRIYEMRIPQNIRYLSPTAQNAALAPSVLFFALNPKIS